MNKSTVWMYYITMHSKNSLLYAFSLGINIDFREDAACNGSAERLPKRVLTINGLYLSTITTWQSSVVHFLSEYQNIFFLKSKLLFHAIGRNRETVGVSAAHSDDMRENISVRWKIKRILEWYKRFTHTSEREQNEKCNCYNDEENFFFYR